MSEAYPTHHAQEDGWTEWIYPAMDGYKMRCCDCALVHVLEFAVDDDGEHVRFRVRRDNRATAACRRRPPRYSKRKRGSR